MSIKKIMCALFAAILMIGAIPLTVGAEAPDVIKGTFSYMPAYEETTEETFYYSDGYFAQSGKAGNDHLLTMSYCLALSTFEVCGATYASELFGKIGFTDVSVTDMVEKPTRDSIGTVIAHKTLGESNLIAVAIRGEKYDSEWASNFKIGKDGDMAGLSESAAKVLGRLNEYISAHGLTNNKIWIVGYSRAGSIADLCGVYINNNLSGFSTTADDLFVYAFEPPAPSVDGTVYDNICVVINKNDIVPYFYMEGWGFHTNGRIVYIGEPAQTVTTYTGLTAPKVYGESDLHELLAEAAGLLAERITRSDYAEIAQDPICDLLDFFFSKSSGDRSKILDFFTGDFLAYVMQDENKGQLVSPVWSVMSHKSDYLIQIIADILTGFLDDLRGCENAQAMTDGEFETLKNAIYPLLCVFGPFVIDEMNYYEGVDFDWYYRNFAPDYLLTEEEFGAKYGAQDGQYAGYSAGFAKEEPDHSDPEIYDDYGPEYDAAYIAAYRETYDEAYALGLYHADHLVEKAVYDAKERASDAGFSDGKEGLERKPYNEFFSEEDWMTDEYVEAYNAAYEEQYNISYDEGMNDTTEEPVFPDILEAYHIISIAKNFRDILKNHYPQVNLEYVLTRDSYYYKDVRVAKPGGYFICIDRLNSSTDYTVSCASGVYSTPDEVQNGADLFTARSEGCRVVMIERPTHGINTVSVTAGDEIIWFGTVEIGVGDMRPALSSRDLTVRVGNLYGAEKLTVTKDGETVLTLGPEDFDSNGLRTRAVFDVPVAGKYTVRVEYSDGHTEVSEISATHALTMVERVYEDCENDGAIQYYVCGTCGEWFGDAAGTQLISDHASVVIPATGHTWGGWAVDVPATRESEGKRHRTCTYCSVVEESVIPVRTDPLEDVPDGKWYTAGVLYCYGNGIMTGTGKTAFGPSLPLTRAMFVTILAKAAGADLSEYTGVSFNDVKAGKWYSRAVEWAYQNGYSSGIGGGLFGIDRPVTREQIAVFLYSYAGKNGVDLSCSDDLSGFSDAGSVSPWARAGLGWAVSNGLISGTSGNTLSPGGTATRAQGALIIMKFIVNVLAQN